MIPKSKILSAVNRTVHTNAKVGYNISEPTQTQTFTVNIGSES